MTDIFRVRIDRTLIEEANKVAEDIGTTPGDVVRLMFKQMVKRRTIPFPMSADSPEDEVVGPAARRAELAEMFD
jgi:addiction module RelB/DinJ family antitoxin